MNTEDKVKGIEQCPHCKRNNPALILTVSREDMYKERDQEYPNNMLDFLNRNLTCFACGGIIETFTINNTSSGIKEFKDKLVSLCGKSSNIPQVLK